MAQKVEVRLISDVSGSDADETISFALDGSQYELDVTSKEADKFRGLFQDYIAVGRKVGGGRGKKASTRASSGSGRSKEELAEIRAWAQQNGHEVSERGRIKSEVLEAYDAAH